MVKPLQISKQQARRFQMAHHSLWPPRRLRGKAAILDYIGRVGCIQFDTVNVVTRNADLVLQSRVKGYKPEILHSLLYEDRSLWDGFDKVQSIYRAEDWPHFARHRQGVRAKWEPQIKAGGKLAIATKVRQAIAQRGPLSSLEIDDDERLEWSWGNETRAARASMEVLYAMGELGIHTRINTRRVFDLVERLLPSKVLEQAHPHKTLEDYHDWHVLRRIGGLGLTRSSAGDRWLGIADAKSPERRSALERLAADGRIDKVEIEGLKGQIFYMRSQDRPTLEKVSKGRQPKRGVAFIAPLDNLAWDREMLSRLFDFDYRWEVYVPAKKRKYGYYVLPVIYGERFVARMDPALDRDNGVFTVRNWWWQDGIDTQDDAMRAALADALREFVRYLGAEEITFGKEAMKKAMMKLISTMI